jgi:protein O-GlcNAc transferase
LTDVAHSIQVAAAHHQAGRLPDAERIYREILQAEPNNADALHLLGVIALQVGRSDVAVELIERAAREQPANAAFLDHLAEAHYGLAGTLMTHGRLAEAELRFAQALALKPNFPEAQNNRGIALAELGRLEDAERCYREALALKPDHAKACNNLGNILRATGRQVEAEQCYRRAIALRPDLAEAYGHLANSLLDVGRFEEAERNYRRALSLDPSLSRTHSNLLLFLNYVPGRSPEEIFAEHREFSRRFSSPDKSISYGNSPEPARKLRVGYVSGDFRDHAAAFFIEPVLARHDRNAFEIFCYSNSARADAVTRRLKSLASTWREVSALNDDALVRLIQEDAIDVLVDLSGHTANNRLPAFGRKPAPVQATWLGYLNTTGLEAMDYRVTDARASPEGRLDALHSEKLARLPDSQWCYRPPLESPPVSSPPGAVSGQITFAAFANLSKIGLPTVDLWARLLARVPGSRLLVVSAVLATIPDDYLASFTNHGIPAERLKLVGTVPFQEYLALHSAVDIVLDTFPYSGGTTTCHALWMGTPVVTLVGETATSRGGASLLHAVRLEELVAQTPQEYLDIAAGLAADPARLASLRSAMRQRMAASPLMDEVRFTRNLEDAYRSMWQAWCRSQLP